MTPRNHIKCSQPFQSHSLVRRNSKILILQRMSNKRTCLCFFFDKRNKPHVLWSPRRSLRLGRSSKCTVGPSYRSTHSSKGLDCTTHRLTLACLWVEGCLAYCKKGPRSKFLLLKSIQKSNLLFQLFDLWCSGLFATRLLAERDRKRGFQVR